jgi:hypothetical protein
MPPPRSIPQELQRLIRAQGVLVHADAATASARWSSGYAARPDGLQPASMRAAQKLGTSAI